MRDNLKELLPLVTPDGKVIGSASRGECHDGSKLLHPVVHLHVFDNKGRLYLQLRPAWKDIQPGKWDTAVGGHVDYGETIEEALQREVREELGIVDFNPVFLEKYVFESSRERELVYAYAAVYEGKIEPSAETAGGKFFSSDEISMLSGKSVFTPNFESEYKRLFKNGLPKKILKTKVGYN